MFFERILTKPFLITIFRYGLGAIGAWLASNQGFDPGTWETISGSIIVIVVALMGGAESVKDKVVQDGKAIDTAKLPVATRNEIKDAVETKKGRTVLDMLFGK